MDEGRKKGREGDKEERRKIKGRKEGSRKADKR